MAFLIFLMPLILIVEGIGICLKFFKVLTSIYIIYSIIAIIFSLILYRILKKKNFFHKFKYGWKKVLSKALKYFIIIETAFYIITLPIAIILKIAFFDKL